VPNTNSLPPDKRQAVCHRLIVLCDCIKSLSSAHDYTKHTVFGALCLGEHWKLQAIKTNVLMNKTHFKTSASHREQPKPSNCVRITCKKHATKALESFIFLFGFFISAFSKINLHLSSFAA
jgi:hypothetical protein